MKCLNVVMIVTVGFMPLYGAEEPKSAHHHHRELPVHSLKMHCAHCDKVMEECVCLYVDEMWPDEKRKRACEYCRERACVCAVPKKSSLMVVCKQVYNDDGSVKKGTE